jgi:hypothetical protein
VEKPGEDSWEAETYTENRAVVGPLIINLKETSKEESDLEDRPVRLE